MKFKRGYFLQLVNQLGLFASNGLSFSKNSEFKKQIFTLVSGTVLSQVIPIITVPLLTRIYRPEDYGILSIFLGISSICNILATLNFPLAIILPKDEEEASNLLTLSIFVSFLLSVLSLVIIFLGSGIITDYFNAKSLYLWLYYLPPTLFLYGLSYSLTYFASRKSLFKAISTARIYAAIFTVTVSIGFGLLLRGPLGLILGLMINYIVQCVILYTAIRRRGNIIRFLMDWRSFKILFLKYKQFPFYNLPSDVISTAVNQLHVFFFSKFGAMPVGHVGMTNRVMGIPINFLATSVAVVFSQKAAEKTRTDGNCASFFKSTLGFLFIISVVPFAVLTIFGRYLFVLFLGKEWEEAGGFAQALVLLFFSRFLVLPFLSLYSIRMKQKELMLLQIGTFVGCLLAIILTDRMGGSQRMILFSFSAVYCLFNFITLYRTYELSK